MTLIAELERDPGCPTLLLARQLPPQRIREAADRGVGQILFHPCARPTLAAALWTVAARGRERIDALAEAEAARRALEDRKRVEIAKGLLMRNLGLSEPEAYQSLRRASQSQRLALPILAASVIESGGLPSVGDGLPTAPAAEISHPR